jgi:hypothetical protein
LSLSINLFCSIFSLGDSISICSPECPRTHYVAPAGLELVILLPEPSECWNYRCVSPLFYWIFNWKIIHLISVAFIYPFIVFFFGKLFLKAQIHILSSFSLVKKLVLLFESLLSPESIVQFIAFLSVGMAQFPQKTVSCGFLSILICK